MNDEDSILSQLLAEASDRVEIFALSEIEQETKQKKLYYHTTVHAYAVKRRANTIFQAIKPTLLNDIELAKLNRIESLINICAIAHDMVQEFSYSDQAYTARKRPLGISEAATINKLIDYIRQINQDLSQTYSQDTVLFAEEDIYTIKEAIKATVCYYDCSSNFIYQPYLYQSETQLSLTATIIALADLGALGIEGIDVYIQEGILIFLEENPDVIELILSKKNNPVNNSWEIAVLSKPEIGSNWRERLLKATRSMVNFAQGRKANFEQEIASLNEEARAILRDRVFKHLTNQTIQEIKSIVPTNENTSLTELLDFFDFNRYI